MKKIVETGKGSLNARWPLLFIVLLFLSFGFHAGMRFWGEESAIEWSRLAYGALAAIIMLFLSSFSLRKMIVTRKLGTMEGWRKSHLYLGLFSMALVFMHTNFAVYGDFGLLLLLLLFLVVLSGMMGELMYRTIPVWLSKQGADAMELDEKRKRPGEYLTLADEIADKTSDEFRNYYGMRIRRLFARRSIPLKYMWLTESDVVARRKKLFSALASKGPSRDRLALSHLESLYADRDKVEFKYARLLVLRMWNNAHVPATAALLTALLAHLWSISYY